MASIRVTHNPDPKILKSRGVFNWPIWTKEISEFPWHYSEQETCYLLEGDVIVTPIMVTLCISGKATWWYFPPVCPAAGTF